MKTLLTTAIAIAIFVHAASVLNAQEGKEFDPREAVKEIQKDLDKIVEDLAELSARKIDASRGERVVENLDKLLEGLGDSQADVVKRIDEIVQNLESQKSNSSSSSDPSSSPPKPDGKSSPPKSDDGRDGGKQKRDRNQGKDGKSESPQGKKPDSKKEEGEDQKGESKDPKGGKDKEEGKQGNKGRRPGENGEEKVPFDRDQEGWGYLPEEVRQLLVEKNFRDYFPDYQREISDYLKSLDKKKR